MKSMYTKGLVMFAVLAMAGQALAVQSGADNAGLTQEERDMIVVLAASEVTAQTEQERREQLQREEQKRADKEKAAVAAYARVGKEKATKAVQNRLAVEAQEVAKRKAKADAEQDEQIVQESVSSATEVQNNRRQQATDIENAMQASLVTQAADQAELVAKQQNELEQYNQQHQALKLQQAAALVTQAAPETQAVVETHNPGFMRRHYIATTLSAFAVAGGMYAAATGQLTKANVRTLGARLMERATELQAGVNIVWNRLCYNIINR